MDLVLLLWTKKIELQAHLLNGELSVAHWNTVHKLQGRPQSVELCTFINIKDTISRWGANPNGIIQETAQPTQDNFKNG